MAVGSLVASTFDPIVPIRIKTSDTAGLAVGSEAVRAMLPPCKCVRGCGGFSRDFNTG